LEAQKMENEIEFFKAMKVYYDQGKKNSTHLDEKFDKEFQRMVSLQFEVVT